MNPVRVAVWGLGRHAVSNILPALAGTDGLTLYGVCSRNPAAVADCVNARACRGWTDAAAMLQDPAVDAVYVATPTGLHAAHGRQVLGAGKHLWCEKPLTPFPHETQGLVEMARTRRLSLCEGLMYLYHSQFERLAKYVSDGSLGAVRSVTSRFGIPKVERASFRDDPALGGGALLDVGCYPVSAIHGLFPGCDIEVVHAAVTTRHGSAVDTDGHAVLALSGGVDAYLEWRTGASYRNEIDLWGDNGSVSTWKIFSKPPDFVPEFRVRDLRGAETTEAGVCGNHFVHMLRFFGSTIADPAAAEGERRRIAAGAETMHMIRTRAAAGSAH